ncbi:hypothetical protein C6H64_17805 [Photorhabdus luminescens]|nr:hypothetical protein C6H64_17805 [Photorhabdus luminescens]
MALFVFFYVIVVDSNAFNMGSLFGYKGGETQFDLMGQRTDTFTNERAIQKIGEQNGYLS